LSEAEPSSFTTSITQTISSPIIETANEYHIESDDDQQIAAHNHHHTNHLQRKMEITDYIKLNHQQVLSLR